MKGKEKCKILKEIRAQIARANDIAWVTDNCTHKGDCRGTCPKCESEVRALERALERRRAMGKTVAVVGLSAGIIATSVACEGLEEFRGNGLDGDMPASEPAAVTTADTNRVDGMVLSGDIALEGEPLPLYYLTDFKTAETERLYMATAGFNLYDVIEGEEGPSGVTASAKEGDVFTLVGHNGADDQEAYAYLVRYQGVLYAIDAYDAEHFTVEITSTIEDEAK